MHYFKCLQSLCAASSVVPTSCRRASAPDSPADIKNAFTPRLQLYWHQISIWQRFPACKTGGLGSIRYCCGFVRVSFERCEVAVLTFLPISFLNLSCCLHIENVNASTFKSFNFFCSVHFVWLTSLLNLILVPNVYFSIIRPPARWHPTQSGGPLEAAAT